MSPCLLATAAAALALCVAPAHAAAQALPSSVATPAAPKWLLTADLNHDGIPDIAYQDAPAGGALHVLLGNGGDSFRVGQVLALPDGAAGLTPGDVNRDGTSDLLLGFRGSLCATPCAPALTVLLGNGDGSFQPARAIAAASSAGSVEIGPQFALADFDGDGLPDIVYADGHQLLYLLKGNGDGSFAAPVALPVGAPGTRVFAADFNGDGRPDLILPATSGDAFAVRLNQGSGSFADPVVYTSGSAAATGAATLPRQLALANIDSDGHPDVLFTESAPKTAKRSFAVPLNPRITAVTGTLPTYAILLPVAPAIAGANVTLTAIVESTTGITSPAVGGSVTFTELFPPTALATALGTKPVGGGGITTLDISTLPVGTDTITCSYSGDSTFAPSDCTPIIVTVSNNPSALTLLPTANPAQPFTPVSFTANLTSNGAPVAGAALTLTLTLAPTVQIVVPLTTDSNGNASYTNPGLAPGTYTVSVSFAGTTTVQAQTATLSETINPVGTSTVLTASPSPDIAGQTLTLSATVTAASSGLGYPAGSIAFAQGGVTLATVALTAASATTASASYQLVLPAGTYGLSATYIPATGFATSTSALSEHVYAYATLSTLHANPPSTTAGTQILFTATVNPVVSNGAGTPVETGTVALYETSPTAGGLGSAHLSAGTALLPPIAFATAGTYTLTCTYSGDTNFAPSSCPPLNVIIGAPTTPTQDFSLAAAPTAVSTQTGHKAQTQLTLSSVGGFGGPVNLACAQPLPLYITCELPSPLTLAANGTASTTLVLATDAVPNAFGRLRMPAAPFSLPAAPALAMLLGLPLLLASRRRALRRGLSALLTLALLAVLATALSACGLGTLPPSTPPGTYTVPVTATSGTLSHSVTITLTVTP